MYLKMFGTAVQHILKVVSVLFAHVLQGSHLLAMMTENMVGSCAGSRAEPERVGAEEAAGVQCHAR